MSNDFGQNDSVVAGQPKPIQFGQNDAVYDFGTNDSTVATTPKPKEPSAWKLPSSSMVQPIAAGQRVLISRDGQTHEPAVWDANSQTFRQEVLPASDEHPPVFKSFTPAEVKQYAPLGSWDEAFGTAAKRSIIPTAAGVAAGKLTTTALSRVPGIVGELMTRESLPGMLAQVGAFTVGSLGGSAAVEPLNEKLFGKLTPEQQLNAEEHPFANWAGGMAPSVAAFHPNLDTSIGQRLMNAGMMTGIGVGTDLATGNKITPGGVVGHAAGGFLLGRPNRIGRLIEAPGAAIGNIGKKPIVLDLGFDPATGNIPPSETPPPAAAEQVVPPVKQPAVTPAAVPEPTPAPVAVQPEATVAPQFKPVVEAKPAPVAEQPVAEATPEPAPVAKSQPPPATPTGNETLPRELAGAKPRFGYGDKNVELTFESDLDKAAYITSQTNKNKRHDDYVAWAVKTFGMTEGELAAHGRDVRAAAKEAARTSTGDKATVKRVIEFPAPEPIPVAQEVPAPVEPAPAAAQKPRVVVPALARPAVDVAPVVEPTPSPAPTAEAKPTPVEAKPTTPDVDPVTGKKLPQGVVEARKTADALIAAGLGDTAAAKNAVAQVNRWEDQNGRPKSYQTKQGELGQQPVVRPTERPIPAAEPIKRSKAIQDAIDQVGKLEKSLAGANEKDRLRIERQLKLRRNQVNADDVRNGRKPTYGEAEQPALPVQPETPATAEAKPATAETAPAEEPVGETKPVSTPEREAKIKAILDNADASHVSHTFNVREVIEHKGSDGKWYTNGWPQNVKLTGEKRVGGWGITDKNGIGMGKRYATEAEAKASLENNRAGNREQFKKALEASSDERLNDQAKTWEAEKATFDRLNPEIAKQRKTPAPAAKPAKPVVKPPIGQTEIPGTADTFNLAGENVTSAEQPPAARVDTSTGELPGTAEATTTPEAKPATIKPVTNPVVASTEGAAIRSTDNIPVQRIATSEIKADPKLMQYKATDEADSGVNQKDKLSGKWDETKAGVVTVWKPNDPSAHGLAPGQNYIVANGHHRLDFAVRAGRPDMNVHVLKESDGWSAADARMQAAEINIADGKGSPQDAVKYLQAVREKNGEAAMDAAAKRVGSNEGARRNADIAKGLSGDAMDLFVNDKIDARQAHAIALNAPGDTIVQNAGAKAAVKGMSPESIVDVMNTINEMMGERAKLKADAQSQGTLWEGLGMDNAALQDMAEKLAMKAAEKRSAIDDQLRAIQGAAKRPEKAGVGGVQVKDVEKTKKFIDDLKRQRDELGRWRDNPELRDKIYAEAGVSKEEEARANGGNPVKKSAEPIAKSFDEMTPEEQKQHLKDNDSSTGDMFGDNKLHSAAGAAAEAKPVEPTAAPEDKPAGEAVAEATKKAYTEAGEVAGLNDGGEQQGKLMSWADETIRRFESGQLGSGPGHGMELAAALAIKGIAHAGRAAGDFAVWSKAMISEFGNGVKPHLAAAWEKLKDLPALQSEAYAHALVRDEAGKPALDVHAAIAEEALKQDAAKEVIAAAASDKTPTVSTFQKAINSGPVAFFRAVGSRMRSLAEINPQSPAMKEAVEAFVSTPGKTTQRDFLTAHSNQVKAFANRIETAMNPIAKLIKGMTPEAQRNLQVQMIKAIESNAAVGGHIGSAIKEIKAVLSDMHTYANESGLKVGEVKDYFPRKVEANLVIKNPAGFVAAAEKAYESKWRREAQADASKEGLSAPEPTSKDRLNFRNQAIAWKDAIVLNKEGWNFEKGIFENTKPGKEENFQKEREFTKEEAKHFEDYRNTNIWKILASHVNSTVKQSELARRLGADGEKYLDLKQRMKQEGVPPEHVNSFEEYVKNMIGYTPPKDIGINPEVAQTVMNASNLLTTLKYLAKTPLLVAAEPAGIAHHTGETFSAPLIVGRNLIRLANIMRRASPKAISDANAMVEQQYGKGHDLASALALELGITSAHGPFMEGASGYMPDEFHENTGKMRELMNKVHSGMFLDAAETAKRESGVNEGMRYLQRLVDHSTGQNTLSQIFEKAGISTEKGMFDTSQYGTEKLKGLGIPEAEHADFADFVNGLKKMKPTDRFAAIADKENPMAGRYRNAVELFTKAAVVQTTTGSRAAAANASHIGRALFMLNTYSNEYALQHREALYNEALRLTNKDGGNTSAGERLMAAKHLAALPMTMAMMYGVGQIYKAMNGQLDDKGKKAMFGLPHLPVDIVSSGFRTGISGSGLDMVWKTMEREQLPLPVVLGPLVDVSKGVFEQAKNPGSNAANKAILKTGFSSAVAPAINLGLTQATAAAPGVLKAIPFAAQQVMANPQTAKAIGEAAGESAQPKSAQVSKGHPKKK
ncbi:hypothetical protein UFOVP1533_23 [uncultured Caudovirales phage]|uniref:Large polyvalent protein associated domain-containing protein n=1 Tax=uncultured Caudovirales phage TaxID=2100421 RepID=A0A6J5QPU0_9CAUD|nr:hypothetical protein UFOVP1086_23 [uncultured Caudovirales phage]CAB4212623.1 hypothetical protein UFOVP1440_23 [uncultured Caudovirales phage]CAB5228247.1 hypothetical protein UFOVP1533_23 [uncultured Caudovirales phage]